MNRTQIPISILASSKASLPHPDRIEGGFRMRANRIERSTDNVVVSIITVVRNAEATIEQAIQSVLNQSYAHIEYIIIDGASTDGTLDIIRKYEDRLAYWVSEPDNGIYDAMNKGWHVCQGDYVYYLGADDILLTLPLKELMIAQLQNRDIVYGNVLLSDGRLFKSKYGISLIFNNTLHHQGLFLRRHKALIGPFNEAFRVFGDFDLNQRLYKQKSSALATDVTIALFNIAGSSNNTNSGEFFQIIRKNYGISAKIIAFCFCKFRGLQFRLLQLGRIVQ